MTYAETVRREVAARYGVPVRCRVQLIPSGVSGLISAEAPPETTNHCRNAVSARQRKMMVEMREGGASFRRIAKTLGRSVGGVYRVAG